MSAAPKQTKAQRLADALVRLANLEANELADCLNDAAALLLRQDELLGQAFRALDYIVGASFPMTSQQEQCWPSMQAAIAAIRAHREAK